MPPDEPPRPSAEAAALERAFVAFVRRAGLLEVASTPCGQPLPPSLAHALRELAERPRSQTELARALRLRKSTVSRLVDDLVTRGWATRTVDEADARVWRVALTGSGGRVADQTARARAAFMARLLDEVPADERRALVQGMQRLVDALEVVGATS